MDDELKPCPFCGKPPAAGIVGVSCVRCHPDDGLGFVARTWEARPIEDALRAEVAALKAENMRYAVDVCPELDREISALKDKLARYTEPLTDEQLRALSPSARSQESYDCMDAAIREVRKEKKDAGSL